MKKACHLHDRANLLLLPLLGGLTAAGLFGLVDPSHVTVFFTVYIVCDFIWIFLEPEAVPSLPRIILFHHVVTFTLLCFPLRYAHLAEFTCWDGLCEINTFFLIARRQWKSVRRLFTVLYWTTFFPLRTFLYPYMLLRFYQEMQVHAAWELVTVCTCQALLIAFNFLLLGLTIGNWKKRASQGRSPPSPAAVGQAAAGAKGTPAARPVIQAQAAAR